MAKEKLTPMMKQYLEIKEEHQDHILFFRLGDFYEMFLDDAVEVSGLLHLTLTKKGNYQMCGIPYHASSNYIRRLLEYGKKIAICEQITKPSSDTKLVKREVVQVITPATVIDESLLSNNDDSQYLLSLNYNTENKLILAYSDILSNTVYIKCENEDKNLTFLKTALEKIQPKEILIDEDLYFVNKNVKQVLDLFNTVVTKIPHFEYVDKNPYESLSNILGYNSLDSFGIKDKQKYLIELKVLCNYIVKNTSTKFSEYTKFEILNNDSLLELDENTIKNLELVQSNGVTLFDTINKTITGCGKRLLKQLLIQPTTNKIIIDQRLDFVEFYVNNREERERVRYDLKNCYDIERIVNRIKLQRGRYQDLTYLKKSILSVITILESRFELYLNFLYTTVTNEDMESISALVNEIDTAINENAIGIYDSGNIILPGYSSELDKLRDSKNYSDELLSNYLDKVKSETDINNLKIGYNKIIGYYIDCSKSHIHKIPDNFLRKQTLVNGERFTTDELKEIEREILYSKQKSETLEKELVDNLLIKAFEHVSILLNLSNFVAYIDLYSSLGFLASENNYCRPNLINNSEELNIVDGRHPTVEKLVKQNHFVKNDTNMNTNNKSFYLITGPNMAGKSTYLRQTALIVIMAHIGSFVPATKADIGIIDKVFCRVGASDNISRGESTFLVEMLEASYIIKNATKKSLVIMDEIGRGTSTQDGMSIAYGVIQKLIEIKCKSLFATHYHELTTMDTSNVCLKTLLVNERGKKITFLRKLVDGVAASSYALHVAKIAGMPSDVLNKALNFQKKHFAQFDLNDSNIQPSLFATDLELSSINDFDDENDYDDIIEELKSFETEKHSPLEALMFLSELQRKL